MSFGALALIVGAGLFGPLLAAPRRFAPPVVVGQIAAGVCIGVSGFGWIDPSDPLLSGLSDVGFALLMFVVGTHLPVRDQRLRAALGVGLGLTLTVALLGGVAAVVLAATTELHRPGIIAVLLITSSGAVALPVLQGLGDQSRHTVVATTWIALADMATVLALPVVLATGSIMRVLTGGALVLAAALTMYAIARAMRDRRVVRYLRAQSHARGWGLDLRVSLLAMFTCAWVATHFGTSILIAGFAIGGAVAMLGEPRRVADQMVGLGEGFAIPLFFVVLGARLDLNALAHSTSSIVLGAAIAAAAVAAHVIASLVWRQPLGFGLMASAQLGVPSAVVSIGLATDQLTASQGAAIMASILVTLGACAVGSTMVGHRGVLTDAAAPHSTGSEH